MNYAFVVLEWIESARLAWDEEALCPPVCVIMLSQIAAIQRSLNLARCRIVTLQECLTNDNLSG